MRDTDLAVGPALDRGRGSASRSGPGDGSLAAKPGVELGEDVGTVRAVEDLGAVGITRVGKHHLGRRGGPEDPAGLLGSLVLVGGDQQLGACRAAA